MTPPETDRDFVDLPQLVPDEEGLDKLRAIAHEMAYYMHFHEVAMDPFRAERWVQEKGRELVDIVGWPKGWRMFVPKEKNDDPSGD